MISFALLGASGFAGGEVLRLAARHPELVPGALFGDSQAGEALGAVHPHLGALWPDLRLERFAPELLNGVDVVFAALPHGHSQNLVDAVLERDLPFVDLGADFRLRDPHDYAQWYGEAHRRPELLGRFVYGLPERAREAIRAARLVAAPGCYPTAAILALGPLVDAGLIDPATVTVDAISGVSGAGKALKPGSHFCAVDGAVAAYSLEGHRHTAEMEQTLGARVLFTPHLAPLSRGLLATCTAAATRELATEEPLDALRAAYADEPFVHADAAAPSTKWVAGSNGARVTARYDARSGRVCAVCAIDNLVKGAAGQMIQCANLMLGLPETSGLPIAGLYP